MCEEHARPGSAGSQADGEAPSLGAGLKGPMLKGPMLKGQVLNQVSSQGLWNAGEWLGPVAVGA
jgi:hypothetical protein